MADIPPRFKPMKNVPPYIYAFLCATNNAEVVTEVFEPLYAHFYHAFKYVNANPSKNGASGVPMPAEKVASMINAQFEKNKSIMGGEKAAADLFKNMSPEITQHIANILPADIQNELATKSGLIDKERKMKESMAKRVKRSFDRINQFADQITDIDTRKKIKLEVSDGVKVIQLDVVDHNNNACPYPVPPSDIVFKNNS